MKRGKAKLAKKERVGIRHARPDTLNQEANCHRLSENWNGQVRNKYLIFFFQKKKKLRQGLGMVLSCCLFFFFFEFSNNYNSPTITPVSS
jgi:hypothetical protein